MANKYIPFGRKQGNNRTEADDDTTPEYTQVSETLIESFVNAYTAVDNEQIAHEVYTIDKLRMYFSAYAQPKMPDPMNQYQRRLEQEGYPMRHTSFNVPGILVRRRPRNDAYIKNTDTEDDN